MGYSRVQPQRQACFSGLAQRILAEDGRSAECRSLEEGIEPSDDVSLPCCVLQAIQLSEGGGQQGVVGVFTGSRHRLILRGGEGRLPCCRSRPRQGRGELRQLERIEMKIGDDDERAASLGAANRRDGRDQPGKGQGRSKGGQESEKCGSSGHQHLAYGLWQRIGKNFTSHLAGIFRWHGFANSSPSRSPRRGGARGAGGGVMSITNEAHDPSVGARRRHLPSSAGEEVTTPFRNKL